MSPMNNEQEPIVYSGKAARANMKEMLDNVDTGNVVVIKRGKKKYYVNSADKSWTDAEYVNFAQREALSWLTARCEDQMVRSWLITERQLLEGVSYPVTSSGTPLVRKQS